MLWVPCGPRFGVLVRHVVVSLHEKSSVSLFLSDLLSYNNDHIGSLNNYLDCFEINVHVSTFRCVRLLMVNEATAGHGISIYSCTLQHPSLRFVHEVLVNIMII